MTGRRRVLRARRQSAPPQAPSQSRVDQDVFTFPSDALDPPAATTRRLSARRRATRFPHLTLTRAGTASPGRRRSRADGGGTARSRLPEAPTTPTSKRAQARSAAAAANRRSAVTSTRHRRHSVAEDAPRVRRSLRHVQDRAGTSQRDMAQDDEEEEEDVQSSPRIVLRRSSRRGSTGVVEETLPRLTRRDATRATRSQSRADVGDTGHNIGTDDDGNDDGDVDDVDNVDDVDGDDDQQSLRRSDRGQHQHRAASATEPKQKQQERDHEDLVEEASLHAAGSGDERERVAQMLSDPSAQDDVRRNNGSVSRDLAMLRRAHLAQFPIWLDLLRHHRNIVCYGIGSKHGILHSFVSAVQRDQLRTTVLEASCYSPEFSLHALRKSLTQLLPTSAPPTTTNVDSTSMLAAVFPRVLLILHSADAPAMRSDLAQRLLAQWGARRDIAIVASLDHVSSPLLWSCSSLEHCAWYWYDLHTFAAAQPDALIGCDALSGASSRRTSARDVSVVLQSLTPAARGLFAILARAQLDAVEEGENGDEHAAASGMSPAALFQQCHQSFILTSEAAMRQLLGEFVDHRLVEYRRAADRSDVLVVPMSRAALQRALEAVDQLS